MFRTALALAAVATFATAPTAGASAALEWVALGDSFAAGVISSAGPVLVRDGCERTRGAYPRVLSARLGFLWRLVDVSCGGATVANMVDEPQYPTGRHLPWLGVVDPAYPFPPVWPQVHAVSAATDLVTVSGGAETVGFPELLSACESLGSGHDGDESPCRDLFTSGADGVPTVAERLAYTGVAVDYLLDVVRARAPLAASIVVGYPSIIPVDTGTCLRVGGESYFEFGHTTYADLDWLRTGVLEPLNALLAAKAAAHGALFVDLDLVTRGHDVCASEQWVEGFVSRTGDWAFVRPNLAGHAAAADAILTGGSL
ncbi:SGNH/GDSL hydrolase family protein [Saccharothrix violaceirubra]|uniref:SGNH hydrolase-type esterase domain-containing protein n=1 Tax=Saccharothrix violaceirubra TaxID=413306 RepID=A0A7W7WTY4_9PSEU|nr:SGNH/GDSL hydrolase family protein [Saccharothrix violaceirubra]MBB4963634.1 hypothetical protein [Saccharothrix violaceirubra]